ncbi:hypothetical protein [Pseudoduganella sp. UC29_106]|uniref:hypothetical protein n=1 Tax=Pseudoduganella sp. UC29_106 TaxID=3374553 RepID=UPI0037575E78
MKTETYSRIVRASALYDLIVTLPFATPWTFAIAHGHLSAVNAALGGDTLPPFLAAPRLVRLPAGQRGAGVVGVAPARSSAALWPLRRHGALHVQHMDGLGARANGRADVVAFPRPGDFVGRGAVVS